MSNMTEYAERELRTAGYFNEDSDYGGRVGPAVLKMVEQFAEEGHSGFSARTCMYLFERVSMFRPLTPLQHPLRNMEYQEVGQYFGKSPEMVLQSTRLSSVFSNDSGKTWHDINKRVGWFRRHILRQSRAYITFPYMPA